MLALAGGLLVSGCSGTPLGSATRTIDHLVFGTPGVSLNRRKIDAIPYASVAARIGSGPRSLIILSAIDGDRLTWVSADRVALVTRYGRIVQSANLPENLAGTQFIDADPVADLLRYGMAGASSRRLIDLMPSEEYNVFVTSTFEPRGRATIEIAQLRFDTVLFREHCVCRAPSWRFTNHYWADARTGFIWKSCQHIHPDLPVIGFEILKPARV